MSPGCLGDPRSGGVARTGPRPVRKVGQREVARTSSGRDPISVVFGPREVDRLAVPEENAPVAADVSIRRAFPSDVRAVADLHVRAWQWAYRGQLPDALLDGLATEPREWWWGRVVSGDLGSAGHRLWVAERRRRLVGFVALGPTMDPGAPRTVGEVYAMYVEPDAVGTGVGRELLTHAVAELRLVDFVSATLWVLETNARARRFYEAAGWASDGARKEERAQDAVLREVRYRLDLSP
jgi:ribosomal protein S18 acetylase RimI-like enzyme